MYILRSLVGIIGLAAILASGYAYSEDATATGSASGVSAELSTRAQVIIDEDNARVTEIFKDIHQKTGLSIPIHSHFDVLLRITCFSQSRVLLGF